MMMYLAHRRCSVNHNTYQGFPGKASKLCTAQGLHTCKDVHARRRPRRYLLSEVCGR